MMTLDQALAKLSRMVASTQEPTLSDDDLTEILEHWKRASIWLQSATHAVNDKIVPTVGNGRCYICIQAGTSALTEPGWPAALINDEYYPPYPQYSRGLYLVSDGSVRWKDAGPAYKELWDLSGAANEAWLEKAARVAHLFDFNDFNQKVNLEQRHQHCLNMAARYSPLYIA